MSKTKADLVAELHELQATNQALEAQITQVQDQLEALQTTYQNLVTTHDEMASAYVAKAYEAVQRTEDSDKEQAEPTPVADRQSPGALTIPSGLLILADSDLGEKGWVPKAGGGPGGGGDYVLDVAGDKAELYAKRSSFPFEVLPSGTVRVFPKTLTAAQQTAQSMKIWARQDETSIDAEVLSVNSVAFAARQAIAAHRGAGPVPFRNYGFGFAVATGRTVPVTLERGANGELIALRLQVG